MALYVFIGENIKGSDDPCLYIALVDRTEDSFRVIDSFIAMEYEIFLSGYEDPVYSNDYVTAWIERKKDHICEISILDTTNIFEGKEARSETIEFRLPKNYYGTCPF